MTRANHEPNERFPVASEEIEPFAAMIIGRMFARCQAIKGSPRSFDTELTDELMRLWRCMDGLQKIAISVQTATHFSIAINNHIAGVARYIKDETGVDVFTDPNWRTN